MKHDAKIKVPDLDKTQANGPRHASDSEAQAIDRAAVEAQHAAQEAWNDLNRSLRETVDPRIVARTHPWISLGIAPGLGFAADAEMTNLAASSDQDTATAATNGRESTAPPDDTSRSHHQWTNRLFDLARVAVSSAIAAVVQAHTTNTSDTSERS